MTQYLGRKRTKREMLDGIEGITKSRLVGNNTVEYEKEDGTRYIRHHLTDILTFHSNGDVIINTDGWFSKTTKERINEHLSGWCVYSDKGIWYISKMGHYNDDTEHYIFLDGIVVHPDGTVSNHGGDPAKVKKSINKTKREIKKYVDGYFKALEAGEVPAPSSGDCWYCSMKTEDEGKSLGDAFKSNDHLISHIKEKYYVPSLLVNVMEEYGYAPIAGSIVHALMCGEKSPLPVSYLDREKRNMKRYLQKRLGLNVN